MPVEAVAGDFEVHGMINVVQPCIFDGEVVYFDGNRRRSGVLGLRSGGCIRFCEVEVGRATLQKDHLSPGIVDSNFTNHNGFAFPNRGQVEDQSNALRIDQSILCKGIHAHHFYILNAQAKVRKIAE